MRHRTHTVPSSILCTGTIVVRTRRRFRHMHKLWIAGEMEWEEIQQRVNSWIGHAQWGDTWKLREQMFHQFPFPIRPKV